MYLWMYNTLKRVQYKVEDGSHLKLFFQLEIFVSMHGNKFDISQNLVLIVRKCKILIMFRTIACEG